MIEVVGLVPVVDGKEDHDLKVCAIRKAGDSYWHLAASALDTGWWLIFGEANEIPEGNLCAFSDREARMTAKMSLLLGDSWPEVYDHYDTTLAWQNHLLNTAGEAFEFRVARMGMAEALRYREGMEAMPIEPGEVIRWTYLNVDIAAGRN